MKIDEASLEKNKEEWEDLAELDIYWAILTDQKKKFGKWNIEDFFTFGEKEINNLMKLIKELGYPLKQEAALDFGCGVGRVTGQLTKYFNKCYGIDISENMITKAKNLNSSLTNCEFIVNKKDNLGFFPNNHFDLIYSKLVLQHLPDKNIIKKYISEFVRTLKKRGLLIFQLPCHISLILKFQLRRRLYTILRSLGINKRFLYEKLRICPMRMNSISEKEVIKFLESLSAKVLKVQRDKSAGSLIKSNTYYVTK